METTKRTIILLLLALLTTGATQSAEKQAAVVSNTRTASCLVKITCDPAILPLSLETVGYLLDSSGVGGKAARDILNILPDQAYDLFTIEYVELDDSAGLGRYGLPPTTSRAGVSGLGEYGSEMSEYDEMMTEMELGKTATTQPGSPSYPSRSRSSSRRSTTASRGRPTTSTSYNRSRRGRGNSLYGYATTSTAPKQRIGTTIADTTDEQTELFSLSVNLPEDVKPLAKEFMNALVENLRQALMNAYNEYENKLQNMLKFAESRRDQAQSQLAKAMEQAKAIGPPPSIRQNPADAAVYESLETIVDLSGLEPSMIFFDVLNELKNSVDPPLQIQPNWKDLLENAEVEPTAPVWMDPQPSVKLRKALEILLDGVRAI
jgi:hypothetical protein